MKIKARLLSLVLVTIMLSACSAAVSAPTSASAGLDAVS